MSTWNPTRGPGAAYENQYNWLIRLTEDGGYAIVAPCDGPVAWEAERLDAQRRADTLREEGFWK